MRSAASTRRAASSPSGMAYECRTTWHAGLFSVDDFFALADTLADAGVAHWALQDHVTWQICASVGTQIIIRAVQDAEERQHAPQVAARTMRSRVTERNVE